MAIVRMKRLHLMAMERERDSLLRKLQSLGCVQVEEPILDDDPKWAALRHKNQETMGRVREEYISTQRAISALNRSAPKKRGMFQPKPTLKENQLLDEVQSVFRTSEEVNQLEHRLQEIRTEAARLEGQKIQLAPWVPLELPLDIQTGEQVILQFGTLPLTAPFEMACQAIGESGELAQLVLSGSDREQQYLLLVCHIGQSENVLEKLKQMGWSRVQFREWKGTAQENICRLEQMLEELGKEQLEVESRLSGMAGQLESLHQLSDKLESQLQQETVKGRMLDTEQTFFLEGWLPAERWSEVEELLNEYSCAYEIGDPEEEDYPQVPVQLKNNWFTRPMNMVTEMYSLPAYGSVDPNPLMAPFFIFFYGFMMADMGYGLLMMLASFIIMKKAKPDGPTMRHMIPLLGLCGVSTFFMGVLTGGFFGDLLPQLAMMIDPNTSFTALPALFSPLNDALAVLIGSLAIGIAQIFTGMAVSMYRKIKRGAVVEALCSEGAWYLVFILLAAGILLNRVKSALIAILVLLVLTQGYGKKGVVGKLMGIFGSLYNNVTGYFSDILSYSRLMALMLAGAVIAQVFNTLGALTGNVITFFLIAMVGNALNLALNLLGCYVHDMRLQCLEYFGRFYEDGGRPFRPLEFSTKYYRIVK